MKHFSYSNYFFKNCNYMHHLWQPHSDKMHTHDFFEIFYVRSGCTLHSLNGEKSELSTGALCILRPTDFHCCLGTTDPTNTMHCNILVEKNEFERVCTLLSPSLYQKILTQPAITLQLSTSQIKQLEDILSQVPSSPNDDADERDTLYRFALLYILKKFFFNVKKQSSKQRIPAFITEIISTTDLPLGLKWSSKNFLAQFPYSSSYICRAFKRYMGMTISEYINNRRLEYAAMLIKTTDLTIMQIAENIGYKNYSYFFRKYMDYFHETPQDTKAAAKKNS